MPEPEETPNYGDNAMFAFLQEASEPCFSPELVKRFLSLSEFQPDQITSTIFPVDSHGQAARLEIHYRNGEQAFIDNVERIQHSTVIKAGAKIGPYCIIGCRVTIEEGVELGVATRIENGATIMADSVAEDGANFLVGSVTGERSIIRQGSEVGYGVSLPSGTVLKEETLASQDGLGPDSFVMTSK